MASREGWKMSKKKKEKRNWLKRKGSKNIEAVHKNGEGSTGMEREKEKTVQDVEVEYKNSGF